MPEYFALSSDTLNSCKSLLHKIFLLSKSLSPSFLIIQWNSFTYSPRRTLLTELKIVLTQFAVFLKLFFSLSNFSWELTLQCQVVFFPCWQVSEPVWSSQTYLIVTVWQLYNNPFIILFDAFLIRFTSNLIDGCGVYETLTR